MHFKTRAIKATLLVYALLFLTACSPAAAPTESVEVVVEPSPQILKTSLGDFLIASSSLVDEVNGQTANPDQKFLLVFLTSPSGENLVPGEFKLEDFQQMMIESSGGIYVTGDGGSQFISNMAGWVNDIFAVGFTVTPGKNFTLYWPDNKPFDLSFKEE